MKSKLIILGCGSSIGVPRIDGFWGNCKKNNKKNVRTRCSAIILKGKNSILIDTSPDIKSQLLSNKIRRISSVIFTHEHADQTSGIFELRPFYWNNKKKINVFGNRKTIKSLKKSHSYLFNGHGDYSPILKSNIIKNKFSIGNKNEKVFFKTIIAEHGKTTSLIYVFEKVAYISDAKDLSIIKEKTLQDLNYLVIDCLKFKRHPSHFNLKEALFVHDILKPKKTILTNLHHDIDYGSLLQMLPKNIIPAYDGLVLNL